MTRFGFPLALDSYRICQYMLFAERNATFLPAAIHESRLSRICFDQYSSWKAETNS